MNSRRDCWWDLAKFKVGSIKYSGNYSYESRIDLRTSQLATFLTSPSTSMTKLKVKFHYRYLYAQADTPTKMLQEVPVIANPLRGVRKYWAVRKGCP